MHSDTKEHLCPRCGKTLYLNVSEPVDDREDELWYDFSCPECGLEITVYVPNEKPEPMSNGNQGFWKCPFCGGRLYWNSDFMFSDIVGENLPEEEDTIVQYVTCSQCGASLECVFPVE
ncbi:MAG: hypothetical protein J6X18_06070 [Bacteroidales bacterium]|nr:hypothetical protein [Bacteroidales bacterium]